MKKPLAALAVLPVIALAAACSNGDSGDKQPSKAAPEASNSSASQSGSSSGTQTGGSTASGSPRTGMSGLVQKSDAATVALTSCKASKSGVVATGRITNTTEKVNSYVIAIVVTVGGKQVDGLAFLANNVAAGKTVQVSRQGKTPVKGTPICKIADIAAVPAG